jgi:hypothetical protein
MINMARTVNSQFISSQPFEVFRSFGDFGEGGWIETVQSPLSFTAWGVLVPASEKELRQLPEGDRILGALSITTTTELFVTRNGEYKGTSDKVQWKGELYKIVQLMPYSDYGFYKALGQRITGD